MEIQHAKICITAYYNLIRWHFSVRSACTPNRHLPNCIFLLFNGFSQKAKTPQTCDLQRFTLKLNIASAEREGFEPPVQLPVHRIS
ncbi:MAG: hypothetical protein K2J51_07545, partial [Alistipes sp.]|nr:hypothetical protein [Alistipes sp.]